MSPASSCCPQPAPGCWGSGTRTGLGTRCSARALHCAVSPTFGHKYNIQCQESKPATTVTPSLRMALGQLTDRCWPWHSAPSDIMTPASAMQHGCASTQPPELSRGSWRNFPRRLRHEGKSEASGASDAAHTHLSLPSALLHKGQEEKSQQCCNRDAPGTRHQPLLDPTWHSRKLSPRRKVTAQVSLPTAPHHWHRRFQVASQEARTMPGRGRSSLQGWGACA